MKYPKVCNWVAYCKSENGDYLVYDELYDETYLMSDKQFAIFHCLDGKNNPYDLNCEYTKEETAEFLEFLKSELLIRTSRVLSMSFGNILISVCSWKKVHNLRKLAAVLDRILTNLWFPIFITSIMYVCNNYSNIKGTGYFFFGTIFGALSGMVLHELAHALACVRYHGKVFEFGIGFDAFFPCAYVLMNMGNIKNHRIRAHILAAGIEMNLFLVGIFLYLACFFSSVGSFWFFAAIQNGIVAMLNCLFFRGVDGLGTISELVGCGDLFQYAKEMTSSKKRRRALLEKGMNGIVAISVCYLIMWTSAVIPVLLLIYICLIML